jgi:hypothetical protein
MLPIFEGKPRHDNTYCDGTAQGGKDGDVSIACGLHYEQEF